MKWFLALSLVVLTGCSQPESVPVAVVPTSTPIMSRKTAPTKVSPTVTQASRKVMRNGREVVQIPPHDQPGRRSATPNNSFPSSLSYFSRMYMAHPESIEHKVYGLLHSLVTTNTRDDLTLLRRDLLLASARITNNLNRAQQTQDKEDIAIATRLKKIHSLLLLASRPKYEILKSNPNPRRVYGALSKLNRVAIPQEAQLLTLARQIDKIAPLDVFSDGRGVDIWGN